MSGIRKSGPCHDYPGRIKRVQTSYLHNGTHYHIINVDELWDLIGDLWNEDDLQTPTLRSLLAELSVIVERQPTSEWCRVSAFEGKYRTLDGMIVFVNEVKMTAWDLLTNIDSIFGS